MRLHLISLPHTQVSPAFSGCAYTAKVLKFCKMMSHHDITVYAPEGPAIPGATFVPCLTNAERIHTFGPDDPSRLPQWPTDDQATRFNLNVIAELTRRAQPDDLILLSMGWTHRLIQLALPQMRCIEPGVGYEGISTDFCAFESYAWMHHVYAKKGIQDGRWFDQVIPNYFDPEEFPHLNQGGGDYLLFLGRVVQRKGPHVAAEIADRCGMKLVVAGAGVIAHTDSLISAPEILVKGNGNLEYIGPVDVEMRAKVLAGARALIVPTLYIEPFGGVAVEAMMAGTPVIASDWGAFTETVENGVTGFRFRTLAEAVVAVDRAGELVPSSIRHRAIERFSLGAVRPRFDAWLNQLATLQARGWYA